MCSRNDAVDTITAFKTCPNCNFIWQDREHFLSDKSLSVVGYQAHLEALETGWFLFNHSCGTTLAIEAGDFRDLYDGPVFQERLTGTDTCPGFCRDKEALGSCSAKCECAYVREILQIVRRAFDGAC